MIANLLFIHIIHLYQKFFTQNIVINFQTLVATFSPWPKRTKQTFFHPSLTPLFTFYIWGISHFTPLSEWRGAGGEATILYI